MCKLTECTNTNRTCGLQQGIRQSQKLRKKTASNSNFLIPLNNAKKVEPNAIQICK